MAWNSTLQRKTPLRTRAPMVRGARKRSEPKRRVGQNKAALRACQGQPCFLRIPGVCLGAAGQETVVPCHSNQQAHGKGMGIKARDEFTVPGCMACHRWLDQGPAPREIKVSAFNRAFSAWVQLRDNKKPGTVAADPGGVQQTHEDEIMKNSEIVSHGAPVRQGGVA